MDGSLALPASLLRVVRSRIEIWENLHQHNNMQNVQKGKRPDFMRSSPRFQLLRRELLHQPRATMHNTLLQLLQLDDETAPWSFAHSF